MTTPIDESAAFSELSDEELGGDTACWAHLFDETAGDSPVLDLAAIATAAVGRGAVHSVHGDDLDVNIVVLREGDGIAAHVNTEVDVLFVGIVGDGVLTVDGTAIPLRAGQAMIVPKGKQRSIGAAGDLFSYLTCHRRRAGLWPTIAPSR